MESFSHRRPDDKPSALADTDQLGLTIRRYNTEVHTSELISETWNAAFDHWTTDARNRGVEVPIITVPVLEVSPDVLEQPVEDTEGNSVPSIMIYYPQQLQGREGAITMGEMFPRLQTRTVKKNTPLENTQDESGWLNVEATSESPNIDTTEEQLRSHFERTGRKGMNENQYIIFAHFMKLISGDFVDYTILNRLLGSKTEGYVINSRFGPDGDLHVNSHLRPSLHGVELGGRSIKVLQRE